MIDGDILLRLTDEEVKEGLEIANCIERHRFMRQLCGLKCVADYTAIDPTGIADFLAGASQMDGGQRSLAALPSAQLTQYAYSLICQGVTRRQLVELSEDDLAATCKIANSIHRRQLLKAAQEAAVGTSAGEAFDFFISYRRSSGQHLACLVKTLLEMRNYRVFLDIDRLKGGLFGPKLIESIKRSRNFLLLLTEGALDRCTQINDWVRREIECALDNRRHIIPLVDRFDWATADTLPKAIRVISKFNAVQLVSAFYLLLSTHFHFFC